MNRFKSREEYEDWKRTHSSRKKSSDTLPSTLGIWIIICLSVIIIVVFAFILIKNQKTQKFDDTITDIITEMNARKSLREGENTLKKNEQTPIPSPAVHKKFDVTQLEVEDSNSSSSDEWAYLGLDKETPTPTVQAQQEIREKGDDNSSLKTDDKYIEARYEYFKRYLNRLTLLGSLITQSSGKCIHICNSYIAAYNKSAEHSARGFSEIVGEQKKKFNEQGIFREIETQKQLMQIILDVTNIPPKEVLELHDLYLEMYGIFEQYYSLALNPPQSIIEFTKKFSEVKQRYKEFNITFKNYIQSKKTITVK